jgi:uncharacterized membrane protein
MEHSKQHKSNDSITYAFLATFLSIVGFVIALAMKRNDKYVMHYAKQSLVLFIAWIVVWVISLILNLIPIIGGIISWILYALIIILWILSWVYALSGKIQYIPVVGSFADKIKL